MRMRYPVIALCLALLCVPPSAHADKHRTGAILVAVGVVALVAGLSLIGTGIWAHVAAPHADTLMDYQRLDSISTGIEVPGGALMILAAPLITLGSFTLAAASRDQQNRVSAWLPPSGLALGGSF